MNVIRVVKTLPRLVDDTLAARLRVMPAVVVTDARQTGKSTLGRETGSGRPALPLARRLRPAQPGTSRSCGVSQVSEGRR